MSLEANKYTETGPWLVSLTQVRVTQNKRNVNQSCRDQAGHWQGSPGSKCGLVAEVCTRDARRRDRLRVRWQGPGGHTRNLIGRHRGIHKSFCFCFPKEWRQFGQHLFAAKAHHIQLDQLADEPRASSCLPASPVLGSQAHYTQTQIFLHEF